MTEDELRKEITASEDSQGDFIKWKLILVAGVGSASLGGSIKSLNTPVWQFAPLLLCLIPLICVYVDLVYFHLTLRIITIAAFLRHCAPPTEGAGNKRYEEFVFVLRQGRRAHPYALQYIILTGSTAVLSLLVLLIGILMQARVFDLGLGALRNPAWYFIFAGAIGTVLTYTTAWLFNTRIQYIESTADRLFKQSPPVVNIVTTPDTVTVPSRDLDPPPPGN